MKWRICISIETPLLVETGETQHYITCCNGGGENHPFRRVAMTRDWSHQMLSCAYNFYLGGLTPQLHADSISLQDTCPPLRRGFAIMSLMESPISTTIMHWYCTCAYMVVGGRPVSVREGEVDMKVFTNIHSRRNSNRS